MSLEKTLLLDIKNKYGIDSVQDFFSYVDKLKYSKEIELGFIKIADILPDSVIIADEDGIIQYANVSALRNFKYLELMGQHITTLMPEKYKDAHSKSFRDYREVIYNNQVNYFYALKSDNTEFPISISSAKYRKNGKYNYIAIIRNLESEYFKINLIKDIFMDLPIMMLILSKDKVEFINKEFQKFTNCTVEDFAITRAIDDSRESIKWEELGIKCTSFNDCSVIVNSTWHIIKLADKCICIGPSKPEILLRSAIEAVIEAKIWINK